MLEYREIRGVRLAFEWVDTAQSAVGELIVFIHGVGANRNAWKPQVAYFSQLGYSVAAIDMRGSGASQSRLDDGKAVPISMHDFAADVDALIQDLGFDRAHWVGNSMGGVIIMEALKSNFTTLHKVVFANTFARHPQSAQILGRPAEALKSRSLAQFAAERIPAAHKPDIAPDILAESIEGMATKDVETYLASWRETWGYDYRESLKSANVQALVIAGSLDTITPPNLSEEIASLVHTPKYCLIDDANHLSNLDQSERFNEIVYEFLAN
jgi:3-oxoadipate enol-lactonase